MQVVQFIVHTARYSRYFSAGRAVHCPHGQVQQVFQRRWYSSLSTRPSTAGISVKVVQFNVHTARYSRCFSAGVACSAHGQVQQVFQCRCCIFCTRPGTAGVSVHTASVARWLWCPPHGQVQQVFQCRPCSSMSTRPGTAGGSVHAVQFNVHTARYGRWFSARRAVQCPHGQVQQVVQCTPCSSMSTRPGTAGGSVHAVQFNVHTARYSRYFNARRLCGQVPSPPVPPTCTGWLGVKH